MRDALYTGKHVSPWQVGTASETAPSMRAIGRRFSPWQMTTIVPMTCRATRAGKRLFLWLLVISVLALAGCAQRTTIATPPMQQPAQQPVAKGTGPGVVQTARSLVGAPYRPGGCDPQGFDCSGFVWFIYRQNGIVLPRTTSEQAQVGSPVIGAELKPADILVFRTGSGAQGLHTGVYTGNNTFVHSPRNGSTVREESLAIPYWRRSFMAARRVFTQP